MKPATEALVNNDSEFRQASQVAADHKTRVNGPYAKYVLSILVVVGVFNYIDRQILSILAEDIKADLGLSDGDLGFLYGTAFAVFYAVFGVPLARVADSWTRTRLISISVGFWSCMTALSGLAKSFFPLALCRFGVGIGEAGASPAGLSLLYDYFSPKVRSTVVGIYASGISIGAGIGLFLGGVILTFWANQWPDTSLAPFGLKGWQAALMIVGAPGILLALLIATLKEPRRGQAEEQRVEHTPVERARPNPARIFLREITPMIPGLNLWLLRREGAGEKALYLNVGIGVLIMALIIAFVRLTGQQLQWVSLGTGLYCAFSWAQNLVCRDPVCFGLIFHCKTVRYLYLYVGLGVFCSSAIGFWTVPWFQRYHGLSAADVGTFVGLTYAVAGFLGMILGGVVADALRRYTQRGKLYVVLVAVAFWLVTKVIMLTAENITIAYIFLFVGTLVGAMAAAPAGASVSDMMIPRTRAVGQALYIMVMNFLGIALGPYCVGLLSDSFMASGMMGGEAIQIAMLISGLASIASLIFLALAIKHQPADEDSLLDRARALGEKI